MKKDEIESRYEGFKIVPINKELYEAFYNSPVPKNTITGFCFLLWDDILGVAGIEHYKSYSIIFSDIKKNVKIHKPMIYRAALFFLYFLKSRGGQYIALTEKENKRSCAFLERLGMKKYSVYGDYAYYCFWG